MAQNFNPESYRKILASYEALKDGPFSKLQGAADNVLEQAKQSGVTKLISSCQGLAEEGVPAILKMYNQVMDSVEAYLDKSKKLYDALGVDASFGGG